MSITGAQSLITSLEAAGVDVVFGIPGGAILPAYAPRLESPIRHILMRHEQGAGHAAEGYAHVTGRPGVCMATSGPGATNLVTPITDAFMDSVPMVAITGQVPRPVIGVPVHSHALHVFDSLLSIAQMPAGVPVGTLAIGTAGATNAALLAASILGLGDEKIRKKVEAFRKRQTDAVLTQRVP